MRIKISKLMAEYMIRKFKDHYAVNVMPLKLWDNMDTLLLQNGDKITKCNGRYYLLIY